MRIIVRRFDEVEKTLTLEKVPDNMVFEFIDVLNPDHCSPFVKMTIGFKTLQDKQNQTWVFDLIKSKPYQFNNSNKVRILEAEIHIIGELNG